jgi:hypothetical protein
VEPEQQPPQVRTPRQERVVQGLRRQIGDGPAEFFMAACELLSQKPPSRAVTHLVGHLLREVEGAVRFVLDPVKERRGHGASIEAVLDDLGISHDEPAAEFWLQLAQTDRGLAMRAHRNALERPRPVDAEFRELIDGFEELLDRVLKRFEDRYANVFARLDELLNLPQPTSAHARQLCDGFPQNQVTLSYFFDRAAPAWLIPLRNAGFFSSPPEPVLLDDEGRFELPFWPQSLYLLRVARDDASEILATALAIPATDNSRVNANLVELAMQFPADQATRLLPQVIAALDSRFGVLVPTRIGQLCSHLARGGRAADALVLAEALLTKLSGARRSRTVMDTWSLAEILRNDFPAVTRTSGLPAVSLLARVLDEAITAQTPAERRDLRQDMSIGWRPAIDGQPAGTDTDPATALVTAIRDASGDVLTAGLADLNAVIAEIESHDWPVFRRLALFLLSAHGTAIDAELLGAHLTDPAAIQDYNRDREFLALARHHCATISHRDQERLLALIDGGPEISRWARQHQEQTGSPPAAAKTRELVSRWQRNRLAAVEPILSAERLARYTSLVAEFGPAPDSASAPLAVRDIAFTSPVTAGELAASSTADIVTLLTKWEPTGNPLGPDRFSLASALSTAVRQDPAGRSSTAEAFIGLPGVYVEAVISAFWLATREAAVLEWSPVLRLCSWADEQAEAELQALQNGDWREWRDVRIASLRLLEAGFAASSHGIPAALSGQAWKLIETACEDPDPVPAAEAEGRSSGRSLDELALELVRPQALTAAVAYAEWTRRGNPETGLGPVQQLIENRLDPGLEPSLAVRWQCGNSFGIFTRLFRAWAAEKAPAIFPVHEAARPMWTASWDGYLNIWPDLRMCETLDSSYQLATDLTSPASTEREELARAYKLGLHLLNRYWHGQLTFENHSHLHPGTTRTRPYQSAPT